MSSGSPLCDNVLIHLLRLLELQQRDEERLANEHARNDLESHIFEFIDGMHSDYVIAVSTEEQREAILASLREASDWLEEDGYAAETKEYKDRLRSLKRVSRSLVRRVTEAAKRPKLVAALTGSLNLSRQFLSQMKNLSAEVQVFSEVEMTTLETLVNETEVGGAWGRWVELRLGMGLYRWVGLGWGLWVDRTLSESRHFVPEGMAV